MSRIIQAFGVLAICAAIAGTVEAADERTGRYVLQRAGDGFIRLDTVTGATAHCRQRQAAWQCDSLSDDQGAMQQSLNELAAENRRLKARVEQLEKQLVDNQPDRKGRTGLPSDEELDEIMGFFEKVMRRFLEFARTLKDFSGKDV